MMNYLDFYAYFIIYENYNLVLKKEFVLARLSCRFSPRASLSELVFVTSLTDFTRKSFKGGLVGFI